ncbi:MAG: ABC transporter substrate-binding protein [Erythrobacter sp.]
MRFWLLLTLSIVLTACSGGPSNAPVNVVLIGDADDMEESSGRLSDTDLYVRSASAEGLVAFGASGEIVPALAERWIITDDGLSYIFRLRNSDWPSGDVITGGEIRARLLSAVTQAENTSLGYDLAKITEIREMTGRVIEIRLASPMPGFLRLLAQPELGLLKDGKGAGPMVSDEDEDNAVVGLLALSPETRGLPALRDWEDTVRPIMLRALPAQAAVDAFSSGDADVVLNGKIESFPSADLGPLSRGNIRLDASLGLFGLIALNEDGVLSEAPLRQALVMAIDRESLMEPFNIGGWLPSNTAVPSEMWSDIVPAEPAWSALALEDRRARARSRIAAWTASSGEKPVVTIGMPPGPGSVQLYRRIEADFAAIGVTTSLVSAGKPADLELFDRTARFASPRWFLNQFNCDIQDGPCAVIADDLVVQSLTETNAKLKAEMLARAELALEDAAIFIPFGAPIRWSLVRSDVTGFEENPWGIHPLFPLSGAPI